jgi:hypothetical protein
MTYFETFFSSSVAKLLYDKGENLLPGGKWTKPPVFDDESQNDLGTWWLKIYDSMAASIGASAKGAANNFADAVAQKLHRLEDDPAITGISRRDIAMAMMNSFKGLIDSLPDLEKLAVTPDMDKKIADFKDASYSVVRDVVVTLEKESRQQNGTGEELDDDLLAQIAFRKAASDLNELVGDPPKSLYIGQTNEPDTYVKYACLGLLGRFDQADPLPSGTEYFTEFRQLVHDFLPLDRALKSGKAFNNSPMSDDQKKQLAQACSEKLNKMSDLLQALGRETKELADKNDKDAQRAAEMSMVFAETVRGVIGEARRKDKLDRVTEEEVDERQEFARAAVSKIKKRETDDERKDDKRKEKEVF